MRLDDYLSTVGIVKRRTVAKELGSAGMIEVNGRRAKSAYEVKTGDIVRIKGSRPVAAEVLKIPTGSVPKTERGQFFKILNSESV